MEERTYELRTIYFTMENNKERKKIENELKKVLNNIFGMKEKNGKIYVQDNLNCRISIFKPNGKFDHSFKYRQFVGENLEIDLSGNVLLNHSLFGLPKGQTNF